MSKTYFTSDLHLGHRKIYDLPFPSAYNKLQPMRPFSAMEECEKYMVDQYNKIVKPDDKVYFLGDILFDKNRAYVLKQMKHGNKYLVLGNHDNKGDVQFYREYFCKIYGVLYLNKIKAILSHIPVHPYLLNEKSYEGQSRFHYNIHGHTHDHYIINGADRDRRYLNASVEVNDYRPISFEELISTTNYG